jgi:uncharacterized protein YecT (DUF1311 family)
MKQLLTAAVLIAGSASNVASGERNLTEAFKVCMAKSEGITSKMNDCISFEHQLQDERLNIAFQQVLRQSNSQWQARVRDVQHKWIAYRNAACELLAPPASGTLERLMVRDCHLNMTAQRAGELEEFLK